MLDVTVYLEGLGSGEASEGIEGNDQFYFGRV
jgi:hypothetical protein